MLTNGARAVRRHTASCCQSLLRVEFGTRHHQCDVLQVRRPRQLDGYTTVSFYCVHMPRVHPDVPLPLITLPVGDDEGWRLVVEKFGGRTTHSDVPSKPGADGADVYLRPGPSNTPTAPGTCVCMIWENGLLTEFLVGSYTRRLGVSTVARWRNCSQV